MALTFREEYIDLNGNILTKIKGGLSFGSFLFIFERRFAMRIKASKAKRNASVVLSVLASAGVVGTAILSARASPKVLDLIREEEEKKGEPLTKKEVAKVALVGYLPAIFLGMSSIGCIFGAQILNRQQQASMASAYALLDQSYKDYRRKVVNLYGVEADRRIIEAIAVEDSKTAHVYASYLGGDCDLHLDEAAGEPVLFYDEYSKRFFKATVEQVLNAEYHLNRNYILRGFALLNELYDFLGLEATEYGSVAEWECTDEGEYWIDFNHRKAELDDGTAFYILEIPFAPRTEHEF